MVHSGLESAHHIGPEWCPCNWDSKTTLEPFRQQSQQHMRVVSNQAFRYQNQLQIFDSQQGARNSTDDLPTPKCTRIAIKQTNIPNRRKVKETSHENCHIQKKVSTLLAHKRTLEKIIPWPPHKKCFFYFASTYIICLQQISKLQSCSNKTSRILRDMKWSTKLSKVL